MKLYVVGIGPGSREHMTKKAEEVVKSCDCVAGYGVYLELIRDLTEGKEIIRSPMKKERARCVEALRAAASGKNVCVVSSGDSGVYGMAALIYEIMENGDFSEVSVEVVPGVTAAVSSAALLGAPISRDFAVISLSDLLVPWADIEKRMRAAFSAGFAVCLYNPASLKRNDYLKRACLIAMEYLNPDTPCGYVRNACRRGEEKGVLTLADLSEFPADMFTTAIIGAPDTRIMNGRLVTPRGYKPICENVL